MIEPAARQRLLDYIQCSLERGDHVSKTIKRTPAMAAGVTDHLWSLREIAGLLD